MSVDVLYNFCLLLHLAKSFIFNFINRLQVYVLILRGLQRFFTMEENSNSKNCHRKGRKCSKPGGHKGPCDKKRHYSNFWDNSSVIVKKKIQVEINDLQSNESKIRNQIQINENTNTMLEKTICEQSIILGDVIKDKTDSEEKLVTLQRQYDKVKFLVDKSKHGKTKRMNNPTTLEVLNNITGTTKSTRYQWRGETKALLQYVHGGESGAIYGAWDFLVANCENKKLEELFINHKRGKFIETIIGKFSDQHVKSEAAMKQAVATKFQGHLSRRKYQLICKIQNKRSPYHMVNIIFL